MQKLHRNNNQNRLQVRKVIKYEYLYDAGL